MAEQLKRVFESLGFRLLAPLFLTVGVVLAVHATLSFRSTRDDLRGLVRADLVRSSGLIERAMHDAMLLNRKDDVQSMIEQLAQGPDVAAIRVYDKIRGKVAMSAQRREIGQEIDPDSKTCLSCHELHRPKDTALLEPSDTTKLAEGPEVMRYLSVIENKPSCAAAACHAHPADQRVLGVLDLEMSMAPLDAAVESAQRQILWTTLILIAVIGVVATVFVRRLVEFPVRQLSEGTRRIAEGDLDTRIDVPGRHELARLAEAFNRMTADLSVARRELNEWSQRLEEKVIEKTAELSQAQRQVLHMEKMASLGKLAASMAHELNNPISGVLTYARLIRRELDGQSLDAETREEWTRYLTLIDRECARCGGIVQNLLLFSRRSDTEAAPVDMNLVVEHCLMLVRHHLEMKGVSLQTQLLPAESTIVADGSQIQQALLALLVNAVEALGGLEPGEGELAVRLRGLPEHIEIEVSDNGSGIAPDVLPHIFEPFFSTKHKENGVGLGLAVVYGIVERHGGRIDVDSAPGRGTTFCVRLPRTPPAAAPLDDDPPDAD